MNNAYTHITLVIDRSGSMSAIKSDAEGSINQFIAEQQKVPGKCSLTLIDFNSFPITVFDGDIADAKEYTLFPMGNTALNDAVGQAIQSIGSRLSQMAEADRPGKVLFVVVTDGEENASREFTGAEVKRLVARQESEYKWQFVFLSSDLNAAEQAATYGMGNHTRMAPSGVAYGSTYSTLSANTRTFRGSAEGASMPTMPVAVDADGQPVVTS